MGISNIFSKEAAGRVEDICQRVSGIYEKVNGILQTSDTPKQGMSIYYMYPYLFESCIRNMDDKVVEDIAVAGALYSDIILHYDKWDDQKVSFNLENVMAKSILLQEVMKILCKYFDEQSRFWWYLDKYVCEYANAVMTEKKKHKGTVTSYSDSDYMSILRGKCAIAKVTIAALSIINNKEEMILQLEKSQDFYAEAFQLFDDLRDWKSDLENKQYTWFITEILLDYFDGRHPEEEEFKNALYKSNIYEITLNKIIELCSASLMYSSESMPWIKQVKLLQIRANLLLDDIIKIKKIENETIWNCSSAGKNKDDTLKKAANILCLQQKNQFPELKHIMNFMHVDGFTGEEEPQCGELFQRLFIFNLLQESEKKGKEIMPFSMFKNEWSDLASYSQVNIKERYKYFPNLPELSSDLDTLSEGIKACCIMKDVTEELKTYIDYAITCTWQSDYFNTWILNNASTSKLEATKKEFAKFKWGEDFDIEVNLNFIYALASLDYVKYRNYIDTCVEWIERNQREDGGWISTWYAVDNYSCYLVAKLAKVVKFKDGLIERMLDYLMNARNENGSWGRTSPLLETAFALLAFGELTNRKEFFHCRNMIQTGRDYLLSQCNDDGYWKEENFIKMNLKRAEGKEKFLYYSSSTITTAVCFCALKSIDIENHKTKGDM